MPVLRKLAVDRGWIMVYLDALASRLDEAAIVRELTGTLREIADPTLERDFDESEHPRDEDGKFSFGGGGSRQRGQPGSAGVEFVSPNVASHLDFGQAVTALSGGQQKALRSASSYIDRELGEDSKTFSIVGAWADGAENSVATVHPATNFETLRVSGAMKGHLADQKQVLVFQQGQGELGALQLRGQGKAGGNPRCTVARWHRISYLSAERRWRDGSGCRSRWQHGRRGGKGIRPLWLRSCSPVRASRVHRHHKRRRQRPRATRQRARKL